MAFLADLSLLFPCVYELERGLLYNHGMPLFLPLSSLHSDSLKREAFWEWVDDLRVGFYNLNLNNSAWRSLPFIDGIAGIVGLYFLTSRTIWLLHVVPSCALDFHITLHPPCTH